MTARTHVHASIAILVITSALAPEAFALTAEDERSPAWSPALAALGDTAARSDQAREAAPVAAIPVLVAVGVDATAGVADAAAPGAGGAAAASAGETRDETERWVPALAFVSGVLGQGADGSVDTNSTISYRYFGQSNGVVPSYVQLANALPAQLRPFNGVITRSLREGKGENFTVGVAQPPGNGAFITGVVSPASVLPASGSDLFLTPFVGASLELMTPGVQQVAGRPRLFAHGDANLAFAFDRPVAKEGIPEGATIDVSPIPPLFTETEVKGVGSKTSGEVQTLLYSGGVGAAFTLDAWERRLRIKPSFEYMRQEIQVSGRLTRQFRKDTGLQRNVRFGNLPGRGNTGPVDLPAQFLAPIDIEATDTEQFHGIGPGLEVEMDAARAGPVMLTLFLTGRAYKMLGNRNLDIEGTDTVTDPDIVGGSQTVSAQFDFNIHSWSYLGGLGLRFRWLPED